MKFTDDKGINHKTISEQDLKEFKSRKILFNSTLSSCLESENTILTLQNEKIFYDESKLFFERLRGSKKISEYSEDRKNTLFYRWLFNFLIEHQETNNQIKYIYELVKLDHLKEASILMFNEEMN